MGTQTVGVSGLVSFKWADGSEGLKNKGIRAEKTAPFGKLRARLLLWDTKYDGRPEGRRTHRIIRAGATDGRAWKARQGI
jgi:hypothetical protein